MQKKLASMAVVILDRKTGQKNLHQPAESSKDWRSRLCIRAEGQNSFNGVAASGMRAHLSEALGGDEGGDGDHGVVAKMEKKTSDDGAGASARESENNTDERKKCD